MNPVKSNLRAEFGTSAVAPKDSSGSYRIPTRNLNVYEIERIFKALGVRFTLIYGQGMEDPVPESTVTFHFTGVDRILAESIAKLIQHLNHVAELIAEDRAEGVAEPK